MADAARSPAWLALAGEISSFMAHLLEMIMGPVADDYGRRTLSRATCPTGILLRS
jgi:MFS-type transporter involved in bile tolerance (Atg22 family)